MAEIGSEYGVPLYECTIKKQEKKHDGHIKGRDETDADDCKDDAESLMKHTANSKGI